MAALNYILNLGSSVVMPIIITILGLILGQKFSKAFRSGMTIGVGFIGINLVIGLMGDYVSPAAKAMVERFGLELSVIDVAGKFIHRFCNTDCTICIYCLFRNQYCNVGNKYNKNIKH